MTLSQETKHVLLVEDDAIDIENVKRALDKLGLPIKLHVARDGVEGLEMLLNQSSSLYVPDPELIILDIKMPKMDGIEFLIQLQEAGNFSRTNVIIFTASTLKRDKIAALKLNVAGYLAKPLNPKDFLPLCRLLLT